MQKSSNLPQYEYVSQFDPAIDVAGKGEGGGFSIGSIGDSLFKITCALRLFLLIIATYAIASIGMVSWTCAGPVLAAGNRVLLTGNIEVDQFYSGLALSAILAPAGILIWKMSNYIRLLHPFAIAARKPVKSVDLDRIMNPGLLLAYWLSKPRFPILGGML
jgi:hypothetical protein